MHYDFAIACEEKPSPETGGLSPHALRLLKTHAAAGHRCAAFVTAPPEPAPAACLGPLVTFVPVPTSQWAKTANITNHGLNHTLSLCETLVAFLREHTISRLEFSAKRGDGFYFASHNAVHRLVPEVTLHLDTPCFIADEDTGTEATLARSYVYAAELETIRLADRIHCDDDHLLGRVLAAFDPGTAGAIRERCLRTATDATFAPTPLPCPAPATAVRLGIVIPHWNDADNLAALLLHLESSPHRARLEIIVVDDCSPADVRQRLEKLGQTHPHVRFLRTTKERSGPFAARLLGVRAVTTDWVAFVDADDLMDPALYLSYAEALVRDSSIHVILPAMQISGLEHSAWIPAPKARFMVYFTGFAHTGIVAGKARLLTAFAHASKYAADIVHCEDCVLSLSLLFGNANILSVPERAYHYQRTRTDSRSQSNGHLIAQSRLARARHFDRCMAEALADGSLTPLDLRLVRQIALSLPPGHSATQLQTITPPITPAPIRPRGMRVPWHTHLYRAWRSLLGDPRYG